MLCDDGKDGSEEGKFSNGGKSFVVIHTFYLCKALHDNMGFILLYGSVGSSLDAEDPLAPHDFSPFWA